MTELRNTLGQCPRVFCFAPKQPKYGMRKNYKTKIVEDCKDKIIDPTLEQPKESEPTIPPFEYDVEADIKRLEEILAGLPE
jgi:hypothetical protein